MPEETKQATPTVQDVVPAPVLTGDGPLSGKKIVWVEDDKFLTELISRKLQTKGCALTTVANGDNALPVIEAQKPDIVMLDVLLPGKDGFQILKLIRDHAELGSTPVIILSNLGSSGEIDKGKQLGATRYLIKASLTLDQIVEEIVKVLSTTK